MPPIYINNCWFKQGYIIEIPIKKPAKVRLNQVPEKHIVTVLLTTSSTHAQIKNNAGAESEYSKFTSSGIIPSLLS